MMNEQINENYEQLLSDYSDVHKDAYGIRPRDWEHVRTLRQGQLEQLINELSDIAQEEADRERNHEILARQDLEFRVAELMKAHSISEADAYRWLIQAEDCEHDGHYDVAHFLWSVGCGCGHEIHAFKERIRALLAA